MSRGLGRKKKGATECCVGGDEGSHDPRLKKGPDCGWFHSYDLIQGCILNLESLIREIVRPDICLKEVFVVGKDGGREVHGMVPWW